MPVSGATCAAALRAHYAHTQLICESAVRMSSGANAHNTAWRDLLASKGLLLQPEVPVADASPFLLTNPDFSKMVVVKA